VACASQGWLYLPGQVDEVGGVVTGPLARLHPQTGTAMPTVVRR
jgi:hypothetical protein